MASSQQKLAITWFNKDKALIPTEQGKYGYSWVKPTDPRYCQTHFLEYGDTVTGVQAEKEEGGTYSERADLTPQNDNLLIFGESGDVLEALTRVPELTDKYVGQVKCVYIDPPFNTAQTFPNYEDNLEHSIWLTMMRDRLHHLRKLLADDGSIWVHLDDVENHRMRMLLDEVFGSGNFVAEVAWEKADSPRADSQGFSKSHDFIIVYRKSPAMHPNSILGGFNTDHYKYVDEDGKRYTLWSLRKWGANSERADRPKLWYPITAPTGEEVWPIKSDGSEGYWRWKPEKVEANLHLLEWHDKGNGLQPYVRSYLPEDAGTPPVTWWDNESVGHNREAKSEIKALFPGTSPFATPKPERLLKRVIHIATNPGDIVLDVFAGSGTTAAVAQKMGRRWVTCELVEDTFTKFTRPRLEKVVHGEDMGGISVTKGERVDATAEGLPEGISAEDAQKLVSLLNKATKGTELAKSADLKAVKERVKTKKNSDTINWRGGGGFTVATLSKPCFDVDPDTGITMLTESATAANLTRAVAAHLRFRLTPNNPVFPAKRGNMNLCVTRQPVTVEFIDEILRHVPEGESVTLAATSVSPDMGEYLHKHNEGSRVITVPDGLFVTTLSDKS